MAFPSFKVSMGNLVIVRRIENLKWVSDQEARQLLLGFNEE